MWVFNAHSSPSQSTRCRSPLCNLYTVGRKKLLFGKITIMKFNNGALFGSIEAPSINFALVKIVNIQVKRVPHS